MKKTIYYGAAAIIAGAMLTLASCSKSDDKLPTIGGFNTSDEIETSSLVAHWTFDNTWTESKQGLAPIQTSTPAPTYVTGVKGQAYKGSGDTYLGYGAGTLPSLTSFTISVWVQQAAQPINVGGSHVAGQGAQGVIMGYSSERWNIIEFENEQFAPKSGDSLLFNAGFTSKTTKTGEYAGGGQEGIVPGVFIQGGFNKWAHFVMTYDGATSKYTAYKDGAMIGANSAWSSAKTPASAVVLTGGTGSAGAVPFGDLDLSALTGIAIGAFPQLLGISNPGFDPATPQSWTGAFQGSIDEIRVYNKALPASEIGSLYSLELAGR